MPKICKHPECSLPIWSRKSMLCKRHQYLFEDNTEKQYKPQKITKSQFANRKSKLKSVSKRQQLSNLRVKIAKAEAVQRVLDRWGYLRCESCGISQGRIDCSHSVPIGRDKSLDAVSELIFLQCPDCHEATEHLLPRMKLFSNFVEMVEKIKKHSTERYNKIKVKFEL